MKQPMVPADSKAWKSRNSLYTHIDICPVHFWPKEDWFFDDKFQILLSWLLKAQAFSIEDETNFSRSWCKMTPKLTSCKRHKNAGIGSTCIYFLKEKKNGTEQLAMLYVCLIIVKMKLVYVV